MTSVELVARCLHRSSDPLTRTKWKKLCEEDRDWWLKEAADVLSAVNRELRAEKSAKRKRRAKQPRCRGCGNPTLPCRRFGCCPGSVARAEKPAKRKGKR